jgi:alpha-glucosidase (family GH31 glycosyl hydrolase)
MMPYNYTLAFDNNQKGTPLMRPLFFEEPNNTSLATVSDTYFWGNDFLVAPITKSNVTATSVYFPKNNNWFDFYTDQKYEAGTTKTVSVNEDHIPVFVRGGAFIPMIKTIQNTSAYSLATFDLHYFVDDKTTISSGKLYNDNGETTQAYEKGDYEILYFKSTNTPKEINISLSAEIGKIYKSFSKNVNLKLHHLDAKVTTVLIDGKNTAFKNTDNNTIEINVSWEKGTSKEIKILY